jgi:hypothetical protein
MTAVTAPACQVCIRRGYVSAACAAAVARASEAKGEAAR